MLVRRSRGPATVVLWTAVLALIVLPAPAFAASRVAAPGASSLATCAPGDPCDLRAAVEGAVAGDDVTVLSGSYDVGGQRPVAVLQAITVHGPAGQPRPVITGSAVTGVVEVRRGLPGAVVSHLAIEGLGGKGLHLASGTAMDMIVHTVESGGSACDLGGGVLVGSVCWHSGPTGHGLKLWATVRNESATVVSSTVVGPVGVRTTTTVGRRATLTIDSSIIMGGTAAGEHDIETVGPGTTLIRTSYSNYDDAPGQAPPGTATIIADHQQTAPPLFADAAFHQFPGSPTVDAGAPSGNHGVTDVDGDPRRVGGGLDIGADEFPAVPRATTSPATEVASNAATLNGTVTLNGAPGARVRFEYGVSTAYGRWVDATPSVAKGSGPVGAVLAGLDPGTTYHFRIVASNGQALATGGDQAFTTVALPARAPSPGSSLGATPGGGGVAAAPTRISGLRLDRPTVRPRSSARFSFRLSGPAPVRLTLEAVRSYAGCKSSACVYFVRLPGSIALKGRKGRNTAVLGRIGGRALRPGKYRLRLRPAGGRTVSVALRVATAPRPRR